MVLADMVPEITAIKRPAPILLAAGMSQRMGGLNKLLLPIKGVPMVRHMALTLVAFADVSPLVVLGHEAERVAAALDGIALTMITAAAVLRILIPRSAQNKEVRHAKRHSRLCSWNPQALQKGIDSDASDP